MAVVTFDPAAFVARFPEFSSVSAATLTAYFNEVTALYLDNTDASKVTDVTRRSVLLNYLVAHMCAIAASALVGRISSATEGAVTVQAAMDAVPGTAAWFMQTKYGAAYWQGVVQYRGFRYVRPPCRNR